MAFPKKNTGDFSLQNHRVFPRDAAKVKPCRALWISSYAKKDTGHRKGEVTEGKGVKNTGFTGGKGLTWHFKSYVI